MSGVAPWPTEEEITFHVRKIMESLVPFVKSVANDIDDLWESMEDFSIEDYQRLGVGGSRIGFFYDGFVYKIEYNRIAWPADPCGFSSEREFENYKMILDDGIQLPLNWNIAPMRLHYVDGAPVIVARYIPGTPDTSAWAEEFNDVTGLFDCMGSNVLISGGVRWVIDLGQ